MLGLSYQQKPSDACSDSCEDKDEGMDYCIVCKNLTQKRYALELRDSRNSIGIKAHVCRDCFNRFLSSHANEGMFRISKFLGWARGRDRIRE